MQKMLALIKKFIFIALIVASVVWLAWDLVGALTTGEVTMHNRHSDPVVISSVRSPIMFWISSAFLAFLACSAMGFLYYLLRDMFGVAPRRKADSNETIPVWCEHCSKQGYIKQKGEGQIFIICSKCDWETSMVWCEQCGMGGGFVKSIGQRPKSWLCPVCKSEYFLSKSFYERSSQIEFGRQ